MSLCLHSLLLLYFHAIVAIENNVLRTGTIYKIVYKVRRRDIYRVRAFGA